MQSIRNQDQDRLHTLNQELSLTNLFMSFGITATLFFVAVGLFALHQSEDGWFLAAVGASIIIAAVFAGIMISKRKQVIAAHRVCMLFSRMHESNEYRELIALAHADKANLHEKVLLKDESLYIMQYAAIMHPYTDRFSLVVFIYGQLGNHTHSFHTIREIDLYKLFLTYGNDQDSPHWTNHGLFDTIDRKEIIDEAKRIPVSVLDAVAPLLHKIKAAELLKNCSLDYNARKAILAVDMSYIGNLTQLDDQVLLDWCNSHLASYNHNNAFNPSSDLLTQIESILPSIRKNKLLELPKNILVVLGRHCLEKNNDESMRHYCMLLSRLVFAGGYSNEPHTNNLWLLRFAAEMNKSEDLFAVAKGILTKYPLCFFAGDNEEDLRNFQAVFGVEEALSRFPWAKRIFIENDLGM
jgi:hypothetical protein